MKLRFSSTKTKLIIAALALPARSDAANKMPQLDFANPLTVSQLVWMAAILVVLYLALSRWALPRIGQVLEDRAKRIETDLAAARQARDAADKAVEALNLAIKSARDASQAAVAEAVAKAKAEARILADAQNAELAIKIAQSEAAIDEARATAMAGLPMIAEGVAGALVRKLIGAPIDDAVISRAVMQAQS